MRHLLLVVALATLFGCSIGQKESLLETAFAEKERRQEFFEATLRVLDDNPEYVDEFFVHANKHPKTMDRFVSNTARELQNEKLAQMTARHLAKNPASLKQVLVQTLEAAKTDAKAREAIATAIEEKSSLATDIIADRPTAIAASLEGTVAAIADKPEARAAFLKAMQKVSPAIAQYLAHNPKTLKAMTKALLVVAMADAKGTMKEILHELEN